MSLCAPWSPFQRVRLALTGDRGRESTLHAESLSTYSYEESSSSSSSSSCTISCRDSRLSSGKAVKSDWLEVSEVGTSRLDWLPSVDENPGQLKLWKVWSFCTKEKKREEMLVCISQPAFTFLLIWPPPTGGLLHRSHPLFAEGSFFVYFCNTGAKIELIMRAFFHTFRKSFRVWTARTGITGDVIYAAHPKAKPGKGYWTVYTYLYCNYDAY